MNDRLRHLIPAIALAAACATTAAPGGSPPTTPTTPTTPAPAANASNIPEGQQQIVFRAADGTFGPCPPTIPFECEMALLEGNPQSTGLFTLRFRSQEPWLLQPHSHPRDERVTVISGRLSVAFGQTVDKTKGQQFNPGDYYVNAANAVHYVWADAPIEIQITGLGPWEVHPYKP